MAWSFLRNYVPILKVADGVRDGVQSLERRRDFQEHWPKCLAATNGDVERAKDMFVEIVLNRPAWAATVLADPPDRARMLRASVDYYIKGSSTSSSSSAASLSSSATTKLTIESSVPGADIEIDNLFVGNTPSTVAVAPGSHRISVRKKGFIDWIRTLNVTGGVVHLSAELEQEQPK